MLARIYRPAKTAMQSGAAKTKKWVLEFEPALADRIEPLMGWTSSRDTNGQVHIRFDTCEEAVAFARAHGVPHQVAAAKERRRVIKAYADNFAHDRKQAWSH